MSNGSLGGYNLLQVPLRSQFLDTPDIPLHSSAYASAFQPAPFASPNPGLIFRDPRRRTFPEAPPSMENPYQPEAAPGTSTIAPTASNFSAYDAFAPSGPSARPDIERDVFNPQMQEAMQRYSQAVNKPHAKMWRQVLGAFLGGQQPGTLGSFISGEEQRRQGIESAAQDYGLANEAMQRQRQMEMFGLQKENIGSEVAARQAATSLAGMEAPFRMELLKAQAEAANYEKVGDELYDLRTKKPIAGGSFPLTADEADALGNHKEGDLVSRDTKKLANAMALAGYFQTTTEQGVFMGRHGSHDLWKMGDSPRNIFDPWRRPVVFAPEGNAGRLTYTTAGEAIKTGAQAPGGVGPQAAITEAKSEVPKNIGDKKVAFNTMIAHANLLRQASRLLHNGDTIALNRLQNAWKNAFGDPGPITAQSIANAYGGEVTDVISKGHITDKEVGKTSRTIDPTGQNYRTIDSVLGAYENLARSKMVELEKQAAFSRGGAAAAAPAANPNDPAGIL